MAFATTNVRKGTCGDIKVLAGDWSGTTGDAAGSVVVEGGRVYSAQFEDQDTGQLVPNISYSTSTSGALTTLTVYNQQTVTKGRLIIFYA